MIMIVKEAAVSIGSAGQPGRMKYTIADTAAQVQTKVATFVARSINPLSRTAATPVGTTSAPRDAPIHLRRNSRTGPQPDPSRPQIRDIPPERVLPGGDWDAEILQLP